MHYKFLIGFLILGLTSCEPGWTSTRINQTKSTCIRLNTAMYGDTTAQQLCACYIEKLVERYPKNNQTPEQIQPIILECAAEVKGEGQIK
jgi:hypothetical protein